MKLRTRIILSSLLVAPILLTGVVLAQETPTTLSEEDKVQLLQRLEKRKNELNIKQVTNTEKLRIQQRCKASQGNLSSLRGRITGIETSRTNVYQALNDRFAKLIEKLKAAGLDTTELEAEIAVLNVKIETFQTDLAAYISAVSDLATMECQTDPVAFKASLEASRTARTKVVEDTKGIKQYVQETIKPILQQLKAQLESTSGGDSNG